ncbi:hypothetical protein XCR_0493 [Xanthomonas campestris pv. raphani 756C]|nr:hypothetical protein XCR_0493 [Xanthomonas campestris pv. raphani 756C]
MLRGLTQLPVLVAHRTSPYLRTKLQLSRETRNSKRFKLGCSTRRHVETAFGSIYAPRLPAIGIVVTLFIAISDPLPLLIAQLALLCAIQLRNQRLVDLIQAGILVLVLSRDAIQHCRGCTCGVSNAFVIGRSQQG